MYVIFGSRKDLIMVTFPYTKWVENSTAVSALGCPSIYHIFFFVMVIYITVKTILRALTLLLILIPEVSLCFLYMNQSTWLRV